MAIVDIGDHDLIPGSTAYVLGQRGFHFLAPFVSDDIVVFARVEGIIKPFAAPVGKQILLRQTAQFQGRIAVRQVYGEVPAGTGHFFFVHLGVAFLIHVIAHQVDNAHGAADGHQQSQRCQKDRQKFDTNMVFHIQLLPSIL